MWRSALAKRAGKLALDYQMTSDIEAMRHTRLSTPPTLTVNMNSLERRLITAETRVFERYVCYSTDGRLAF